MNNLDSYDQRKQKWEEKNIAYNPDSTRQATFFLTVKNTLDLLGSVRSGKVLDIGCGFGEIDILLAKNTDFNITGVDISKNALDVFSKKVQEKGLSERIKIEEGDVYNLKYPDNYFDIILSFGYVSAATYRGVQKEIARVLKPGGILVCDFINPLSVYKIPNTIKRKLVGKETPYFISLSGIRREFDKNNLIFKKQRFFNTYPPLHRGVPAKIFLYFENTVGKILNRALGRVRLVSFVKK
jgi:ubiquinone/menaquinone biosynthesis C-methylase UbiE